ncbi:hypothetical protein, partial [Streptomyces mutomycini]|uniref:hypothetical protein n=1 Tax=Streptomyces mutomycini TaxID=284036 RepID=UPI00114C8CAA
MTNLLKTARLYRLFLAASRELNDGDRLKKMLFNERNGPAPRRSPSSPATHPEDQPSEAKDKGRLVASYVDRGYAM